MARDNGETLNHFVDILTNMRRTVGFQLFPRDGEEFLTELINEVERMGAGAPLQTSNVRTTLLDEQLSNEVLVAIRELLDNIKKELGGFTASNAAKSEVTADILQIEVESERPTPRRRFMKLYLESLRDNLAKAAGTGTIAAIATIGAILAKYFGVF
jgi:hypothetical protein